MSKKRQHRRHPRADHGRPLGDSQERDLATGDGLAQRDDLGPRVGRHDRRRRGLKRLRAGGETGHGRGDAGLDPVHRELVADDAGRCDQTCSGRQPRRAAARSAVRRALASPWAPVAALALPELITMARMSSAGRSSRHHLTGAAHTRLVVNVPAAAHGRSAASTAMSSAPDAFNPALMPLARKPRGMASVAPSLMKIDSLAETSPGKPGRGPDTTTTGQVHRDQRAV